MADTFIIPQNAKPVKASNNKPENINLSGAPLDISITIIIFYIQKKSQNLYPDPAKKAYRE